MCNLCNINNITGKGNVHNFHLGWTVYLSETRKFVIGHDGDRIELPIKYCPMCGRKLK